MKTIKITLIPGIRNMIIQDLETKEEFNLGESAHYAWQHFLMPTTTEYKGLEDNCPIYVGYLDEDKYTMLKNLKQ